MTLNKSVSSNISISDILLYIDLKNMTNAGIYSNVSVEADIPIYTKLLEIEPSFFDIELIDRETSNNQKITAD